MCIHIIDFYLRFLNVFCWFISKYVSASYVRYVCIFISGQHIQLNLSWRAEYTHFSIRNLHECQMKIPNRERNYYHVKPHSILKFSHFEVMRYLILSIYTSITNTNTLISDIYACALSTYIYMMRWHTVDKV